MDIKDDITGDLLDKGGWSLFVDLDALLTDMLFSSPKTSPSTVQAAKVSNVAVIGKKK